MKIEKEVKEKMERKEEVKARPTIGLFAGIFNEEGKLLVKRRPQGISLAGEWDLPGGAVEEEANAKALDERVIGRELAREVKEEVGIEISISPMLPMFPAVLKGGTDWAFVIVVGRTDKKPSRGEIKWVSPDELKELAERPPGNRLVSGWGKRMCRLALMALCHSTNKDYRKKAIQYLQEIQASWE